MIDAFIQSATLFAVVAIVTRLLKRRSPAALRHLLWAFAILGALVAPIIARFSPLEFRLVPVSATTSPATTVKAAAGLDAATSAGSAAASADAAPDSIAAGNAANDYAPRLPAPMRSSRRIAWMKLLAFAWGGGAVILLLRMAVGFIVVHRVAARSDEITDPAWRASIDRPIAISSVRVPVEVRISREAPVPYTCGLRYPTIVLPHSARAWSAERRDAVLLHELAHISRGDLVMNILSHFARALYWPNPLAWLAANGLRYEGERAADDAVLRAGARASDYADHLLDIVKSVGTPVPKIALAMARSSDFEGRLLAILEPGVPRTRLSRARAAAVAAVFAAALIPLTAMTTAAPLAAPTPASPAVQETATPVVVKSTKPMNTAPLPAASATIVALGGALSDADADVRLAAVNSLGGLQDPAAIAALAKALHEDTDARVREAAAWALGEIDDNRAVPSLLDALKTERVAKVRVKIVEALHEIDDASAVSGVSGALKDGSVEVRRAAVEALGSFGDVAAIPALASMIHDDDVQVRRQVAEALGELEDDAARQPLTTLAQDHDAEVRANAIEGLHHYESMSLVPVFVAALRDSNAHVREHAADGLGSIDDLKTAPRALIDALSDPSRDVRRSAASALANIGDEAAVPALKKLVTDTDTDTRREAVDALKEIGGPDAIQALMALLKDSDPEIRKSAAEALGRKRP
jgi:HEAT repeat protein/beta-lactamase regulating signal transducer with metallopeptidase domain